MHEGFSFLSKNLTDHAALPSNWIGCGRLFSWDFQAGTPSPSTSPLACLPRVSFSRARSHLLLAPATQAIALNVSFSIFVRWLIYIINPVHKPIFHVSHPHRRSTTVSSETNPLYSIFIKLLNILCRLAWSPGSPHGREATGSSSSNAWRILPQSHP